MGRYDVNLFDGSCMYWTIIDVQEYVIPGFMLDS